MSPAASGAAITADADDETLREHLRRRPRLLDELRNQANQAYCALATTPLVVALNIGAAWSVWHRQTVMVERAAGAGDDAARLKQLRIAIEARNLLCGIVDDVPSLGYRGMQALLPIGIAIVDNTRIQPIIEAHPGLRAFFKWRAAAAAVASEGQRRDHEHQATVDAERVARARDGIVRDLVGRLAGRGVVLSATDRGITARPAALLSSAEADIVRQHRAELTALLAPPAELVT
jgi:hypothetical protein